MASPFLLGASAATIVKPGDVLVIRAAEICRFTIEASAIAAQGCSQTPHTARWIHSFPDGTIFAADQEHLYLVHGADWSETLAAGFEDIVALEGSQGGRLAVVDRGGKRVTLVDSATGLGFATIQNAEYEFVEGRPWQITFGAIGWYHEDLIGFDSGANVMLALRETGEIHRSWVFSQVPIPLRIPQDVFALRSEGEAIYVVALATVTVFGDRESRHRFEAAANVPEALIPALSTLTASDLRDALESNPSQNLLEIEPLASVLRAARANLGEHLEGAP